ncbi:MAG: hypothetical protein RLY20_723 [Verrucomicrobiota bacterium]
MKTTAILSCLLLGATAFAGPKAPPPVITQTAAGLKYEKNERGDRVPDFSSCGYAAGNRDIPVAPVCVVVAPVRGDETERIQRALDYVGSLPVDTNGLRGTVLLLKGRHEVSGALLITNSGVVLRGQGADEDVTTVVATGLDRRTLIRVQGRNDRRTANQLDWQVTDAYAPVGATSFSLKSAGGLKAGDHIRVIRPSTQAWIDFLGANDFGGGEGGGWKPSQYDIVWNRTITAIDANTVTLDAPITTALDTNFGGGRVETFSWPGRIENVGVENLQLESVFEASNPKDENHAWCAITMENTLDAWVRQVTFQHFAASAVALYESCRRITVEDCRSLAPVSEDGGYRRNTFFTMGQQTLFLRCFAERGRHDFAVGDCAAGPNAFVQCEASLPTADSGAIESWSSGTLFDNVRVDGNALSLGFRPGNMESIGWAAANSVLWNCSASVIRCWNPPGAQNWSFGSWAGFEGDGVWRDSNNFMRPESLYAEQLAKRNGRRVQLMARSSKESTNPTIEEATALIAASKKPAPLLTDYIAAAAKRNPIPVETGSAKRVEDLPAPISALRTPRSALVLTNGWLTVDGKLLIGGGARTAWWRGSMRPTEAPSFDPAITRFVPGRIGDGMTDDLASLAELLAREGKASFEHHYGLWYDLRRDDHERVRRMTGDVIPPLFEQPFARSGQGTAWDGLSQYDLTKPNPWYWSRLKQFADLCEQQGLVLFNQNYFQHNILEAGAHWVDCPWRTANNINGTDFPEPPPFAGDKRIFMAEQFYDVTHPVRRKLHEGFIRQNLENFKDSANVIQFTSAEYTGPLHFTQFWLDTISDWEREHYAHPLGVFPSMGVLREMAARRPIIALSATKDVQDAILADAKRAAVVDVIDFRYWYQTDKGLYDPKGGQNLAPRQHDRYWKNVLKKNMGTPSDANLAQMAAEYRSKFPGKAVIQNAGHGGWAYVCAGGSIPELPVTTDARLLAAIPRMQVSTNLTKSGRWVLREAGKQWLVYGGGELDLSGERGAFRMNLIEPRTGVVTKGEAIQAGAMLKLPGSAVVWLTKE